MDIAFTPEEQERYLSEAYDPATCVQITVSVTLPAGVPEPDAPLAFTAKVPAHHFMLPTNTVEGHPGDNAILLPWHRLVKTITSQLGRYGRVVTSYKLRERG